MYYIIFINYSNILDYDGKPNSLYDVVKSTYNSVISEIKATPILDYDENFTGYHLITDVQLCMIREVLQTSIYKLRYPNDYDTELLSNMGINISIRRNTMSKYDELMIKSDECSAKALEFYKMHDIRMSTFYYNASKGYKSKTLALTIQGITY